MKRPLHLLFVFSLIVVGVGFGVRRGSAETPPSLQQAGIISLTLEDANGDNFIDLGEAITIKIVVEIPANESLPYTDVYIPVCLTGYAYDENIQATSGVGDFNLVGGIFFTPYYISSSYHTSLLRINSDVVTQDTTAEIILERTQTNPSGAYACGSDEIGVQGIDDVPFESAPGFEHITDLSYTYDDLDGSNSLTQGDIIHYEIIGNADPSGIYSEPYDLAAGRFQMEIGACQTLIPISDYPYLPQSDFDFVEGINSGDEVGDSVVAFVLADESFPRTQERIREEGGAKSFTVRVDTEFQNCNESPLIQPAITCGGAGCGEASVSLIYVPSAIEMSETSASAYSVNTLVVTASILLLGISFKISIGKKK